MNMQRRLLSVCILSILSSGVYAADCDGERCGLDGARGAMEDESRVVVRADLEPTLPEQGERMLPPREKLVLWGMDGLTQGGRLNPQQMEKTRTVVLKDAVPYVRFESGRSVVDDQYVESLRTALQRLKDKANLRLRIIGHTDPERLSARSKKRYGDNYGLGLDRARRVGRLFLRALSLDSSRISYDSKGPDEPIASNDTLAGMALNRRVEVQIWYDEPVADPAPPGLCPGGKAGQAKKGPFRLSVDGKPVADDDAAHSADVQRCTDVALEADKLQLKYDNLSQPPRLNVALGVRAGRVGRPLPVLGYSNYLHWIAKAELRVYGEKGPWREPQLLESVPLDAGLAGSWTPSAQLPEKIWYRLRVYDSEGRFDETEALPLRILHGDDDNSEPDAGALMAAYGGNRLVRHTIPVEGGTVTIKGRDIDAEREIYVMGRPVVVDGSGSFVSSQIIPQGKHTVEVAMLDEEGRGPVFRRDLELPDDDWFYVGIADLTIGQNNVNGPADLVTNDQQHYEDDRTFVDGRLAFYAKGRVKRKYTVTASADTGEEPFGDLFTNFTAKNPRAFLRRMDANRGWSTFGDDSTLVEDAPTRGKFYIKAEDGKSHVMWGNFKERLNETELTQVDRSLYGAQLHYEGEQFTAFGERRFVAEGFAADPGTVSARQDFRGTGGSVYFLHHQDITQGSERVRIEVRDRESGLVLKVKNLSYGIDYDIDPIQGRILLNEPLSSVVDDNSVVRASGLSGNPAYLVVNYEYAPGFTDMNDLAGGGRVSYWLNDSVQVGGTLSRQENFGSEQKMRGVDVTLRKSERTWVKLEGGKTDGAGLSEQSSTDGGFLFQSGGSGGGEAEAKRAETAFAAEDLGLDSEGTGTLYVEKRDAGYSAPGRITANDIRQSGGSYTTPVGEDTELGVKVDTSDQTGGPASQTSEFNIAHHLNDQWTLSGAIRSDEQQDTGNSDGRRDDVAVQAEYADEDDWSTYGYLQGTARRDAARRKNGRAGVGGRYQVNDRTHLSGELSGGDMGPGAKAGIDYAATDKTNLYLNYLLDSDRGDNGIATRRGQLVSGVRSRWNDHTSVYVEERYQHGDQPTGLTQAYGVDYAPDDHWSYGLSLENGELTDKNNGSVGHFAVGSRIGYSGEGIRYGGALEYRKDDSDLEKRTVWLMRNNLSTRVDPNWRAIARLDFAVGDSSRGSVYDGNFTEASLGYAYRPVNNDRLNALVKYTYLSDLPPPEQVSTATGSTVGFAQRSNVLAFDTLYDLTPRWSVGGKYAYRIGELRPSRDNSADWFTSTGQLMVVRADWHVVHKWDLTLEGRRRDEFTAQDSRSGSLVGIYRHVGQHLKLGVGYNFTDFSDDLTDMSYDSRGAFINIVGKM